MLYYVIYIYISLSNIYIKITLTLTLLYVICNVCMYVKIRRHQHTRVQRAHRPYIYM